MAKNRGMISQSLNCPDNDGAQHAPAHVSRMYIALETWESGSLGRGTEEFQIRRSGRDWSKNAKMRSVSVVDDRNSKTFDDVCHIIEHRVHAGVSVDLALKNSVRHESSARGERIVSPDTNSVERVSVTFSLRYFGVISVTFSAHFERIQHLKLRGYQYSTKASAGFIFQNGTSAC
jgi:hypothetical protein